MKKNEGGKKQKKPEYGLGSNLLYMVRHAAEFLSVLWLLGIETAAGVAVSVTTLYMAPSFLRCVEAHDSFRKMLLVILFFSLAMIGFNGLEKYVKTVIFAGRIQVRMSLIREVNRKLGGCSYPLLFRQEFQDRRVNARKAVINNVSASEKYWETLYEIMKNGICFLIYLFLMMEVKPILIAVTLLITVMSFGMTRSFERWGYLHRKEEAEGLRKADYFYNCAKSTKMAKDIRIFGMKEWLWDIERDAKRLIRDFSVRSQKNDFAADAIKILLDLLRNGVLYAYLLGVTIQGGLSASEFLLYFTAASGFTDQVTRILFGVENLYRHSLEISNVREFCGIEEPFSFEGGKELKQKPGELCEFEIRDVTFRYPNAEKPVLEHFNLKIRAGEKLAVVGLNGAGKTTLIKLLCGLYDPDSGEVLLNGVNIREYNREDYYKLFGAVFQDFSLLAGSIAENIAQSHTPDMERVRRCTELAGMKERIERFSDQYHTKLGKEVYPEEALELSGGELQRLMLARMLYKGAPVMMLDEPTAALDALAERDLYERYAELTEGSTAVFISHRLASTRFCDRVLLLGDGEILEEGTHEELMELGGKYAELFEIQSKYYKEGKEHGED